MATKFNVKKALEDGYTPDQISSYITQEQAKGKKYDLGDSQPVEQPKQEDGLKKLAIDALPIIGAIGGSFIPGLGTIAGGALGAGAGAIAKNLLDDREGVDAGDVVKETALGATGGVLGKVGGTVASRVLPKITSGASSRLMNSVYREPIKATKAAVSGGETLGEEALKRGQVGSTKKLFETAVTQIDNTENTLQQILMNAPQKVSIDAVRKTVQPLISKYKQAGNTAAANALEARVSGIEAANGSEIPAAAANQIKRSLYSEADKAYGTEASANMEGIKAIARGIKEGLEPIPGVKQLNKDLSFYGRQRDSMVDKLTRDERNNIFGLTNSLATGTGIASGQLLPAAAFIAGKQVAGSTLGKTALAQGINKVGQLPPIIGTIGTQTTAQGAVRLPESLVNPASNTGSTDQPTNNNSNYNQQNMLPPIQTGNSASDSITTQPQSQAITLEDGTVITPESIRTAYIQDLASGGKNAAKLKAAYEFLFPEDKNANKPLNSASAQMLGKANAASAALNRVQSELAGNPNKLLLMATPGAPGARQLEADYSSLSDAIGGLRTGASVSKEQQAYYRNLLPKVGDSPATIQSKLAAVQAELQFYIDNGANVNDAYGSTGQLPPITSGY